MAKATRDPASSLVSAVKAGNALGALGNIIGGGLVGMTSRFVHLRGHRASRD